MINIIKTILGLSYSDEEGELLDILKKSKVTRKVYGRGTIELNVSELYQTEKFKEYQKLAESIVNNQRRK